MECVVMFQPHLFSRTNDFATGFAESLSEADEVVLLDIYPARELPMPGVTSELISKQMTTTPVTILSKEDAVQSMRNHKHKLVITAGAGDIDKLIEPIKNILLEA
jgi:UDP-N-acetylmuramate--alanine ligase